MPRRRNRKADSSDSDDESFGQTLTKRQLRHNQEIDRLALGLVRRQSSGGDSLTVNALKRVLGQELLGPAAVARLACTAVQIWGAVESERSYGNIVDQWLACIEGLSDSRSSQSALPLPQFCRSFSVPGALSVQSFDMERMVWSRAVGKPANQSPTTEFSHAAMLGKLYTVGGRQKQTKGPKKWVSVRVSGS